MNIFITGSNGLIGTQLTANLRQQNHQVLALNRIEQTAAIPQWDLACQQKQYRLFADSFVHLAGVNIAAKRWSQQHKHNIYASRIEGTKNLIKQILASPIKPHTFICASAIGYYGNRGYELLTENSTVGTDFVSQISHDWEQATVPLTDYGIRVVNVRFGVVLSEKGGALKKMLLPFKLGLGGKIGSGEQKFSWISLDDAVAAILFLLNDATITGAVNVTSPNPVSNLEYTQTLAKILNRPAILPMPAFICRLIFGQMADELLLSSQNVMPKKLLEQGFEFDSTHLEQALSKILR